MYSNEKFTAKDILEAMAASRWRTSIAVNQKTLSVYFIHRFLNMCALKEIAFNIFMDILSIYLVGKIFFSL